MFGSCLVVFGIGQVLPEGIQNVCEFTLGIYNVCEYLF